MSRSNQQDGHDSSASGDARIATTVAMEDTPARAGSVSPTPPHGDAIADRQLKNTVKGQLFGSAQTPVRIDRFTVIKQLGIGGMGVVFSAYDDELERKVAIKLLQTRESRPGSEGRARLLREAQAMAKLSHPNVVQVFEVGTHDGSVFVAMEYVKGQTLRSWLGETRSRGQILDVFTQAGHGLAAAHTAGIVHRDFKPENVMVESGGRVRVLDFGLARPDATREADLATVDDGRDDARPAVLLGVPLTQEGTIVGTPSYMAPEQHAGHETDARTDQFSFCVSLYEALYGERPFRGKDFRELSRSVMRGELAPEPGGTTVPGWLRDIVVRGLAVDPASRYPSMAALLEALAQDPTADVRRYATMAAFGMALVGALAAGVVLGSGRSAREVLACAPAQDRLAGVWDPQTRTRLRAALTSMDADAGERAFESTRQRLDDYTTRWSQAYAATCELDADVGEVGLEQATKRIECLDGRLHELGQLTAQVANLEGSTLPALEFFNLQRIERCESPTGVDAMARPPADANVLADVTRTRLDIARAISLAVSDQPGAREAAAAAVVRARATGYKPVEAEALLASVHAGWGTGSTPESIALAEEAALVAEAAGDLFTFVEAAFEAAETQLVGQAGMEQAQQWIRRAEAAMERIGDDIALEARRMRAHGTVKLVEYEHEEAVKLLGRALELAEAIHGPEHIELTTVLNNLAVAQQSSGLLDEARANLERHASIIEKNFGSDNQHLAYSLMNTGGILVKLGRLEEGLDHATRALELIENNTPENHPRRALALAIVARDLDHLERMDDAIEHLERAERIIDASEFDMQAAYALVQLAGAQHDRGRYDAALTTIGKFIVLLERQFSGKDLAGDERYAHALALAGLESVLVGKNDQAVELAKRSLETYERKPAKPQMTVMPRYVMARALAGAGDGSAQAAKLASVALRDVPQLESMQMRATPSSRRFMDEMRGWLERHAESRG